MIQCQLYYFAYGSNMSLKRLQARVPSAEFVCRASVPAYQLRFHKAGVDGSAKADAFFTGNLNDRVEGALFTIDYREKPALDKAEGLGVGYDCTAVTLATEQPIQGSFEAKAFTYTALQIDADMQPFHWYREHVLIGAREAGLPDAYISGIEAIQYRDDPDADREARELSLYAGAETVS